MSLKANNFFCLVELTLIDIDTASTTTIKLSNRPVLSEPDYFPILLAVDGLGSLVGDSMPLASAGRIVVSNSAHSLGYERRFSDLFDKYTCVDQQVIVYSAFTKHDDNEVTTDRQQDAKARVQSYRIDPQGGTITLSVTGATIEKREVTKPIDDTAFLTAPDSSKGNYIPLVIGQDVPVKPLLIDPEGTTNPRWVYCTTFADDFVPEGIQQYYLKNFEGVYKAVRSGIATSAVPFFLYGSATITTSAEIDLDVYGPENERAYKLYVSASDTNYIATEVSVWLKGAAGYAGAIDGQIIVRVYERLRSGDEPGTLVAEAKRDKADFDTQLRSGTESEFRLPLVNPLFLSSGFGYWVSIEETAGDEDVYLIAYNVLGSGGTGYHAYRNTTSRSSSSRKNWRKASSSYPYIKLGFYVAKFTETIVPISDYWDQEGRGQSLFEVSQYGTSTQLDKLDFIVTVNGITDDGSGTITGSAGSVIETPLHVAKLLTREWDSGTSAWVDGVLDTSKLTSSHTHINNTSSRYYRKLSGAAIGRVLLDALLGALMKESCAKMCLVNSTTSNKFLGIYGWGSNLTAVATITDEDAEISSIEQRGTESLVNRVQAYYDKSILNLSVENVLTNGALAIYGGMANWYSGANTNATSYTQRSESIYGKRYLNTTSWDWINDATSAEHVAEYILASFAKPQIYVELRVPLQQYRTLEIMDVVEIAHPDLPSFYGTSADARNMHYQGSEADVLKGFPLKRTKRYRAQIEGRQIDYNFGEVPELKLSVRLLLNYPKDPT